MKKLICIMLMLCLWGCSAKPTPPADTTAFATLPSSTLTEPKPAPPPDPLQLQMEDMTDQQLVGQLFLARYPGTEAAQQAVADYHIGGFVLFGKDLAAKMPSQIRSELEDLQQGADLPLLIAVDEEGGTVTRVSSYSQYRDTPFPSPRSLYDNGGLELVLATEREKCNLLLSVGICVNLAPVCDVTTDPNAFMYDRSLGQSPEDTGKYVAAVVELMHSQGVGNVLKHFPGYGNNDDTHIGTAVDDRSLDQLETRDLVPFQAGIDSGCDAIMVSHTTIACLDPQLPGSLSPAVIGYLRQNMGFDGVIMTDDLAMEAITDVYGVGESAVMAVLAGNDILCCSDYDVQYQAVLQAVQDGRISRERLYESVLRVLRWKQDLGLIK